MSNQQPDKNKATAEEIQYKGEVLKRFMDIQRVHFGKEKMMELEHKYKHPDAQEIYQAERELLRELRDDNGKGVKYGLCAGLVSFLVLRRGPPVIGRWLARRGGRGNGSGSGSYQFGSDAMRQQQQQQTTGNSTKTTTTGQSQFGSGSFNNYNSAPAQIGAGAKVTDSIFWKIASFTIDVFLSLNVAAYVGNKYTDVNGLLNKMAEAPLLEGRSIVCEEFKYTDVNGLLNKMAEAPLLEGRSIVCEELCGDFIREYRSIPPEFWAKADGKSPFKICTAIEKFAYNCKRRQIYEQQLKDEGAVGSQIRFDGLQGEVRQSHDDDTEHIPIPSPGVPPNIPVSFDDNDVDVLLSSASLSQRKGDINGGDDDDFVMDQQVSNEYGDFGFQSVDTFMGEETNDKDTTGHDWSSIDDFENGNGKGKK
eukprot:CAMPEP_0196825664 /NCGR_PEP_ID=MMETSP1362-20130617/93192_1 /TAXON_ID=163516 /ORGANISM="Leptocylindrus danicus, Strain CCMP1856" /LENGTH=420 /DNA_ID=CAMNT_0042206139 /DNA_START=12 /DNA_END=1275 /DNA_ORIENTATION=+